MSFEATMTIPRPGDTAPADSEPSESDALAHAVTLVPESGEPPLASVAADADSANAADMSPSGVPSRTKTPSIVRDWIELTKPRIVTMILVTTVASAWIAMSGQWLPIGLGWLGWMTLLAGTGLVAGAAGAANQIWERDLDQFMPRTATRPLPTSRISARAATLVMLWALVAGLWLLHWRFGAAPAMVGLATWLLYVLIYTPMKTRTAWNTTVGAVAGAMPVFMGYTAAGGTFSELDGWMLFGLLAFWQYPHFMAIAWLYRRQYGQAGFQMTTTIDPSGRHAGWQSIVGSLCLIACAVVACVMPHGEPAWTAMSLVTSVLVMLAGYPLVMAAWRFSCDPVDAKARKMLRWSLVVLPAVLLVMTLRVAL